ncbi:protein phosphatase 1 regulatory subunit 37-like [Lates japonicus]
MLILMFVEDFNGCILVCDQQDEFLMETHTRLQSEITQCCLTNARLSGLAVDTSEMLSAAGDRPADSVTTA